MEIRFAGLKEKSFVQSLVNNNAKSAGFATWSAIVATMGRPTLLTLKGTIDIVYRLVGV